MCARCISRESFLSTVNKFWKAGWFSLGMFLDIEAEVEEYLFFYYWGEKSAFRFLLRPTCSHFEEEKGKVGEKTRGDRERASEVFLSYF